MCGGQEEQNRLQSMQAPKMPDGWDVKIWFSIWETIKLVQNTLLDATKWKQAWTVKPPTSINASISSWNRALYSPNNFMATSSRSPDNDIAWKTRHPENYFPVTITFKYFSSS